MTKAGNDSWSNESSEPYSYLINDEIFIDFSNSYSLRVADYNSDGFDDLFLLNLTANSLSFIMNPYVIYFKKLLNTFINIRVIIQIIMFRVSMF